MGDIDRWRHKASHTRLSQEELASFNNRRHGPGLLFFCAHVSPGYLAAHREIQENLPTRWPGPTDLPPAQRRSHSE